MKAVLCSGQLANGKDMVSDRLAEKLNEKGKKWHRIAFASAVKSVFEDAFGVDRQFIEDWKRNPEPPPGFLKPVRQSLQFIGDGFRTIKEQIWIEIALRDESRKVIISDGRYFNEAKAVKAKGGINVLVYRPGYINNDPNLSEAQLKPLLEFCAEENLEDGPLKFQWLGVLFEGEVPRDIEHYDFLIINDGTLEDLYNKVDNLLIPYIKQVYSDE